MRKSPFAIGFLLPFLCTAFFQWYQDPMFLFSRRPAQDATGWWWKQPRIASAFVLRRLKPTAISIGTSRNESLPSDHSGWGMPVVKIVLPSATLTEMRQYIEHAQAKRPLRRVTVELSYENVYNRIHTQFNPDRLLHITEPTNRLRYLRSIVEDINRALFSYDAIEEGVIEALHTTWDARLRYYEQFDWLNNELRTTSNTGALPQKDPMDELKKMITFGLDHNINMYFFIAPLYAPYAEEEIARQGYTAMVEQWHRDLVTLFETVNREKGRAYPLWDFSGYNSVTTEEIPAGGTIWDTRWFSDERHFKTTTGKMILDRMFNTCSDPCPIPEDFGVLVTTQNIEEHLVRIRQDRDRYLKSHPK